jgi:flagellar motor component MotA
MGFVIDGTDEDYLRHLLTLKVEREHDYYRKKLMEIAMEGVLCIQRGDNVTHTIFLLSALVDIKNNPLDTVCVNYLTSANDLLDNIDFMSFIQSEEESEEVCFIRRVLALSELSRKEGILALEKHLDHNGIASKDIFEYGLPLIIDGWDYKEIDRILTILIGYETNPLSKNLALAKKEAIRMIYEPYNPFFIKPILLAFFDKSIAKDLINEGELYEL